MPDLGFEERVEKADGLGAGHEVAESAGGDLDVRVLHQGQQRLALTSAATFRDTNVSGTRG